MSGELINEAHEILRGLGRADLSDAVAENYGKIVSLRAELTEARRLIDEARTTFVGIAGATARAWELPRNEFIDEFLPWAQSRARDAVEKMKAAPVPQPAVPEAVAKDVERLDWLVSECAVVQSLAISPPHGDGTTRYYICWPEYGEEQIDTYATAREAIDAAILSATDSEVKNG